MDPGLPLAAAAPAPIAAPPAATAERHGKDVRPIERGRLFLTFVLATETFAIDIVRIREIIEYSPPTAIPMMPRSLRGVINVRGSVVPVVDLSVRFGWPAAVTGRRTSIVMVEIIHGDEKHVLGLVVDRVNAVTEIRGEDIEAAPAFGARVNTEFIAGMARCEGRFVIILNIERSLSVQELAAVAVAGETSA